MGEVYRATDTSLGRDVAIKTLPTGLATDSDRLARFEREAQLLASLNHAHIASIYSLDAHDGTRYLAMELVEGVTLEEKLKNGPLPTETALELALQITQALEAAHGKGVIHRDLKPANVMITPDGVVKVLDFGLAKAFSTEAEGAPEHSPALSLAMTQAGMILGTAGYMAPEQASGQAADQRADIWAFGVLLYEMLTGQPVFSGESVPHILADVLKTEPDWRRLPKNLHPRLKLLLERCLRKKPRERYHSIADARIDIEDVLRDPDGITVPVPAKRTDASADGGRPAPRRFAIAACLVAAGGIIAGFGAWILKPTPPLEQAPIVVLRERLEEIGVQLAPLARMVAIAPDGLQYAFRAAGAGVPGGTYLRTLDSVEPRLVSGTRFGGTSLTFSPDGRSILFWTDGQINRIAITGGVSVALAPAGSSFGADWSPDGTILYATGNEIRRVAENGGEWEVVITAPDSTQVQSPQRLPGGDWILYVVMRAGRSLDESEIVAESLTTGERRSLHAGATDVEYVPSTGHLVYAINGVLYALPFDIAHVEVTGPPLPVIQGVTAGPVGIHQFDISARGDLIYVPGYPIAAGGDVSIAIADRGGEAMSIQGQPARYEQVRASPSGELLAIETRNPDEDSIIWIHTLDGQSSMRRLTFAGNNSYPVWSPYGDSIAFQSDRDGAAAIYRQRADGTGGASRLTTPENGDIHIPESWSPDSRFLSFSIRSNGTDTLWILSLEDGSIERFSDIESTEPIGSVFSPDGKWIAYHTVPPDTSPTGPNAGIFVEPFPATGARYQAPKILRDFQPFWSRDGTQLYYIGSTSSSQIISVSVSADAGLILGSPVLSPFALTGGRLSGATRAFDAMPDGRFVGPVVATDIDDSGARPGSEIRVILNWAQTLRQIGSAR